MDTAEPEMVRGMNYSMAAAPFVDKIGGTGKTIEFQSSMVQ